MLEGIHFSKVTGFRRAIGGWTQSQIFLKDFVCKSAAYSVKNVFFRSANLLSIFSDRFIFYKITLPMN